MTNGDHNFKQDITLAARAMLIADSIANGQTYRQIVAKYQKEWGVSYNYMHSIITESLNLFKSEEIYKNIRDINLERLTDIYQQARTQGDLDTAIRAVDKINKTAGVYDTEKPTVNVQTDDGNVTITFGGVDIETLKGGKTEDVPFNEVESIMEKTLKSET